MTTPDLEISSEGKNVLELAINLRLKARVAVTASSVSCADPIILFALDHGLGEEHRKLVSADF